MPALRLFGRKWLAASDDLVFPCLFEICFRLIWLGLLGCVSANFISVSQECVQGGLAVRIYLISMLVLIIINIIVLIALVNRSAQGSITDTHSRRHVAPLLVVKIGLILPELGLNIFGTLWAFCNLIQCSTSTGHKLSKTVIEAIVLFNWVVFALIIFGLAIVFDPLGSVKFKNSRDSNDNTAPAESILHRKVANLWLRRFRLIFCCLRRDEYGHEAFSQVAGLLSTIFRGTDLVPSDIMAGCILLRVRQKRETREMRRIRLLQDDGPRYSTEISRVFATSPSWMTLKNASYFMKFALASYGWPMVCYMNCCSSLFRLISHSTCCGCFSSKAKFIENDNCCMCHVAGMKVLSELDDDNILFATFKNHVFELPFCVLADHKTKNIVISVRGSLSMRDIFTDLTANPEKFEACGFPVDAYAHRGMIVGAENIIKKLAELKILERAFVTYPDYSLVIAGHSLGAGVAILAAAKLRERYSDLRVYAYSTPAGLLSREAAKCTESFVFTVGVGDDFVMRLGVDAAENLRTSIIETLRSCKLPKWRIMLNGVGYVFFGVPSRDLENTWKDVREIEVPRDGQSPLLHERGIQTVASNDCTLFSEEISSRRFSKIRLFTGGRILHIARRKKTELEKKSSSSGPTFEMRWATAEDFMELKVMPRMFLDHLPSNILKTINTVIEQQKPTENSTTSLNTI